ncbi:MAG: 1-deoxy-D-xylulose-5-phosphate synthase [Bacilli bacterium]|jgi:1-deoxy-D-xylulose-5-phosphate synthase|nr:1-deoxy-D-xylulose-5-phosphate synthase [Bacilli bacterium]
MDLTKIENPYFLKNLNNKELKQLAKEIRSFLIESISQTGGHLSSNLGIVELSIALHYVFNAPQDKIFFDVGHQSYVHKILTGRAKDFTSLRQLNGLSGYQKRNESAFDCFEGGHSSTTISAALGMAIARDLRNEDYNIIPVIGDGALINGVSFEALNNLGHLQKKVIIILNDNGMSISKNTGAINSFLDSLRISMSYNKTKQNYKELLQKNKVGQVTYKISKAIKEGIKHKMIDNMFTELNLDYIGPLDGHDFKDLKRGLEKAKNSTKPIVVHVITKKGKGYKFAEEDMDGKWHGVGKFDIKTGEIYSNTKDNEINFSKLIANEIYNKMRENDNIVTITPAMISGSKLNYIFKDFPNRSFDVGIAESHAAMMAAGLALNGMHPFLSVYSTFSQRCYDQFNHDISRMDLPVVIGLDRSGIVGEDGATHHGVFDIALFRNLPNFTITAPGTTEEVKYLVNEAFTINHPYIIRYSRDAALIENNNIKYEYGKWINLISNKDNIIISYGVHSKKIMKIINENNYNIGLIHALYIKPLDYSLLDYLFKNNIKINIYEPDIKGGGFGSSILEYANNKKYDTNLIKLTAIDDIFISSGKTSDLYDYYGFNYEDYIKNCLKRGL